MRNKYIQIGTNNGACVEPTLTETEIEVSNVSLQFCEYFQLGEGHNLEHLVSPYVATFSSFLVFSLFDVAMVAAYMMTSSSSSSTWMLAMTTPMPVSSVSGSSSVGPKSSLLSYSLPSKMSSGISGLSAKDGSISVSVPIACSRADDGVLGHSLDPL